MRSTPPIFGHTRPSGKRHWPTSKVMKYVRGWMLPYFKSRILPGEFQPIIAYLFTEWECNLDCRYCWSPTPSVTRAISPHAKNRSTRIAF